MGEHQELLQELAERAFDEAGSVAARHTSQRGAQSAAHDALATRVPEW